MSTDACMAKIRKLSGRSKELLDELRLTDTEITSLKTYLYNRILDGMEYMKLKEPVKLYRHDSPAGCPDNRFILTGIYPMKDIYGFRWKGYNVSYSMQKDNRPKEHKGDEYIVSYTDSPETAWRIIDVIINKYCK